MEKFDPSDPRYKKVSDLPEEQQLNYIDVEGGFITRGARDESRIAESVADANNDIRPIKDKILGRGEFRSEDILQWNANNEDRMRQETQKGKTKEPETEKE